MTRAHDVPLAVCPRTCALPASSPEKGRGNVSVPLHTRLEGGQHEPPTHPRSATPTAAAAPLSASRPMSPPGSGSKDLFVKGALMKTKSVLVAAALALGMLSATATAAAHHDRWSDLDKARKATAGYRQLDAAQADGYRLFTDAQGAACIDHPGVGGMGVHYVRNDLVGDASVDAATPEALVYEPGRRGRPRLAAVEYVVFQDQWDAGHDSPPALFGREFALVPAPNRYGLPAFYALHAWLWKHNPRGLFDDWNPRVTCRPRFSRDEEHDSRGGRQERFLYAATIAQSATDPDFVAVIGADPRRRDFGKIVNRVDMPGVGDELHHFGYSADQQRLIVPGLFSNRIHIFDIKGRGKRMALRAVNEELAADSGYVVPHGSMTMSDGRTIVPMIGSANDTTRPGGIVEIDDRTGAFEAYFGPGPVREPGELGPKYMYDFAALHEADRGISTTFGPPALCGGGIDPTCLGDEVSVWDLRREKVIQVADLGSGSGALEVRFIREHGVRRAFINTPGTNAVWLADDDDGDGVFDFQQVLGPDDGLVLPADMLLSYDHRYLYLTNWFGNTVQQFDISDPFNPALKATVPVPHPNMLRLSRDNGRLYVSNSLLTPWDNDPHFGGPRNNDYGIWRLDVDTNSGGLTPSNPDGRAWVSFTNVQKKTTTGPAGPHMMLFDPSIPLEPGEH
jgi:methanethiol oxidase